MTHPAWLPPLTPFGGDWSEYEAALYSIFRKDFVLTRPTLDGKAVVIKRHPITHGKEAGFWHLISEGPTEEGRLPDLRRCERLVWVRAMIEAAPPNVRRWQNKRGTAKRALISLPDFSYVAVLDIRVNHFVVWTGYPIEQAHRREKFRRECEAAGG
jgi:hypothetical protein